MAKMVTPLLFDNIKIYCFVQSRFYFGGITLRVWLHFNLLNPTSLPCLVQEGQDCLWGVQVGLEECVVVLERYCQLWRGTQASCESMLMICIKSLGLTCILLCLPLFVDSPTHCAPVGHTSKGFLDYEWCWQ